MAHRRLPDPLVDEPTELETEVVRTDTGESLAVKYTPGEPLADYLQRLAIAQRALLAEVN